MFDISVIKVNNDNTQTPIDDSHITVLDDGNEERRVVVNGQVAGYYWLDPETKKVAVMRPNVGYEFVEVTT
jgi:hypothetical protein